jgi:lysozyme
MNKKTVIIAGAILILLLFMQPIESQAEDLIKAFEGKKLKAYQDSAGIWTIGYGSIFNYDQNRQVQQGDEIDDQTALTWLRHEISTKRSEIKKLVKVPVTVNQLDSLTSFAYNIGINAFKTSTLLNLLNAGKDKNTVANQFLRWNKARVNGKLVEIKGLTNRRILEKELFLK